MAKTSVGVAAQGTGEHSPLGCVGRVLAPALCLAATSECWGRLGAETAVEGWLRVELVSA